MPIPIVIADDNPMLVNSIKRNMELFDDFELLYTAQNGQDLLEKLPKNPLPAVILMDIEMPTMNGIEATKHVYKLYGEQIKILILSVFDEDDNIFEAIKAGATGYLLKDEPIQNIINAITDALAGNSPMSSTVANKILDLLRNSQQNKQKSSTANIDLTKRELEVLQYLGKGCSFKQIAINLNLSNNTVRKHCENIYKKLHINSKYEAMAYVQKHKI
jgi:DNA-binding NarL/FixJ family response regulator